MPHIVKAYRQRMPALRLIGKQYVEGDRDPDGSYMSKWNDWFRNGWFGTIAALGSLPENEGAYVGCTYGSGTPTYWIGMFFPEGTRVPEGFQHVDVPAGDVGVCWIRGRREGGDIFRRSYDLCVERIRQEGWRCEQELATSRWPWVFERYQSPRFTEPDEAGNVILDYGIYLQPEPGIGLVEVPPAAEALAAALHRVAVDAGCAFHTEDNAFGRKTAYSVRNITVSISDGAVELRGEYDIRAFLKLYRETRDDTVKQLLFGAAIPCCYCIDDKCTTLLMAKRRTIEYRGKSKRLCGPYRHVVSVPVTEKTLAACTAILGMMLEYVYPSMHTSLSRVPDDATYTLTEVDAFYIVGYKQRHSPLSSSDEDFAASLLRRDESGRRRVDALAVALCIEGPARFVGATNNFSNGVSYDFIFGVVTPQKPSSLPEGAVCRKVRGGRWAVYNSASASYPCIWRHFTERFSAVEHMGYDDSRIPFEYYDEAGRFSDVHIPVDADMPDKSGMVLEVTHTPNELLAGFTSYAETDYPLYRDRPFDVRKRIAEAFPHAQCLVRVSIHASLGKPLVGFDGVPIDDLSAVPDGMECHELKGGYWRRLRWKHFNGGYQGWGEAIEGRADSAVELNTMHHPRGFNEYVYAARGGYSEIGVPMRLMGKRSLELLDLAPQVVVGKREAPPESVVTEDDIRRFYDLAVNLERGSYVVAFTYAWPVHGEPKTYFDKPFIQGVSPRPGVPVPEGLETFTLDSGAYVRVKEDTANGVIGWDLGGILDDVQRVTGRAHDATRRFIYKQYDYGRRYEIMVPVA